MLRHSARRGPREPSSRHPQAPQQKAVFPAGSVQPNIKGVCFGQAGLPPKKGVVCAQIGRLIGDVGSVLQLHPALEIVQQDRRIRRRSGFRCRAHRAEDGIGAGALRDFGVPIQPLVIGLLIIVQEGDQRTDGLCDAGIAGVGHARFRHGEIDQGKACRLRRLLQARNRPTGISVGRIVHHHDFNGAWTVEALTKNAAHRPSQRLGPVQSGNDDADVRALPVMGLRVRHIVGHGAANPFRNMVVKSYHQCHPVVIGEGAAGGSEKGTRYSMTTHIAFVGLGYVADMYRDALHRHGDVIVLSGVYDHNPERCSAYAAYWGDRLFPDLDALLAEKEVEIVVNLTDPENHETVTRAALAAGKHVYSEKPLAMTTATARALAQEAAEKGLRLAAAPCTQLSESSQTLIRAVRSGIIGDVRLIYAEIDDGMIHRAPYRDWSSASGAPWPARGEFEVGCTFEHAGYYISLLVGLFGPVETVTSFSSVQIDDKRTDPPLFGGAPDFSAGCLTFAGGVVARLTCSVIAPYDHRFRVIGEEGVLALNECWDYGAPVRLQKTATTRLGRAIEKRRPGLLAKKMPLVRTPPWKSRRGGFGMDFPRGIAELARSIREDRPSRLSPELAVHVTEVTEMLQHPERFERPATVESTCPIPDLMEWADHP